MEEKFTFEAGMEELEGLVARMETGDMKLDESFDAYRRGVVLYRALKKMLDEGDAKIRALTETGEVDLTKEVGGE